MGEHAAPESAPASDRNEPSGQSVQLVAPGTVEKAPAAHGSHADADAEDEKNPGAHAWQVALKKPLAAVPLDVVPTGHGAHAEGDDAPTALELLPGGHALHSDPGDALSDPGAHGEHAVAPAGDEVPTAQSVHTPVPFAAAKLPLAHGVQTAEPSVGAAYPGAHKPHERLASVETAGTGAEPTGHFSHAEGERYTDPSGQPTHEE